MNVVVDAVDLTDEQWERERDAITRRFLGISALEFVERYNAGEYDDVEPDGLMTVLGYFPELD